MADFCLCVCETIDLWIAVVVAMVKLFITFIDPLGFSDACATNADFDRLLDRSLLLCRN